MNAQTEAELTQQHIEATLAGDQKAFGELVKLHESMLLAFAHYRLPHAEEACEAVQDTFLRAYEQLADFDIEKDFGTWLRSICRYQILSRAKAHARRKIKHDDYKAQLTALAIQHLSAPPEPDPTQDLLAHLRTCTATLSETNQGLIHDRYAETLSTQQISEKTGRTVTWVTSTLHRVRSALRACIETKTKEQTDDNQ